MILIQTLSKEIQLTNQLHAHTFNCLASPSGVSFSKKLHPYCLVLVGSRNEFERDFTIELK